MVPPKRGKQKETPPETQGPVPQQGQTFFQRISAIMPSMPRRLSTENQRAKTAPNLDPTATKKVFRRASRPADQEPLLIPRIKIPTLSDQPCPYDAEVYYSFPRLEKSRSCLCGLRSPSPSSRGEVRHQPGGRPCSACRARSPVSHLNPSRRSSLAPGGLETVVEGSVSGAQPDEGSSNSTPRRSSMPRIPSLNRLFYLTPTSSPGRPPTRRGYVADPDSESNAGLTFDQLMQRLPRIRASPSPSLSTSTSPTTTTPTSPKLHRIHGLPRSEKYPYVHKHEVQQHLSAAQAGLAPPSSPLASGSNRPHTAAAFTDSRQGQASVREPYLDFSETVFYGHSNSPLPFTQRSTAQSRERPIITITETIVTSSSSVSVDSDDSSSVDWHVQDSRVYRQRLASPEARPSRDQYTLIDDGDSGTAAESEGVESRGARRGRRGRRDDNVPRLRGGAGSETVEYTVTRRCLLTCHEAAPPPGTHYFSRSTPVSTRTQSPTGAVARLPLSLTRVHGGTSRQSLHKTQIELIDPTILHPQPQFPPELSPSPDAVPGLPPPQPIPHLRGGAGRSTLLDTDRLPPTLWFLAGGRGRPMTVAQWKTHRPKKRMGGLLGMAVFGTRAGKPYKEERKKGAGAASGSLVGSDASLVSSGSSSSSSSSSSSGSGGSGRGRGRGGGEGSGAAGATAGAGSPGGNAAGDAGAAGAAGAATGAGSPGGNAAGDDNDAQGGATGGIANADAS
ncbi:hypothetical protein BDV95DRAFT_593064 [Massariosphaeria phaeospora]|uniref:Uncharacterized protein n=1 Tax=Massariosphaeria phaeospora TaxID=100035 RepID=A0A7C8IB88_9PLEO|nr:hypothetical protein BDV95DRAFT_593064 [Massariosphaeria phaeospora]